MSVSIDCEKFKAYILSLHRFYTDSFQLLENKFDFEKTEKILEIQDLLKIIKWKGK